MLSTKKALSAQKNVSSDLVSAELASELPRDSAGIIELPIQTIEQAITEISSVLESHKAEALANLENLDPNKQILGFETTVSRLEEFLGGEQIEKRVGENFSLQQYTNLMKNQLLHVSLTNQIEMADSLRSMYPHEMPYEHDGRFPGYPTALVLENVKTYLESLNGKKPVASHDFKNTRTQIAQEILSDVSGSADPEAFIDVLQTSIDNAPEGTLSSSESLRAPGEEASTYLRRLQGETIHDPGLAEIVIKQEITFLKKDELRTLKGLTSTPMTTFDIFQERVEREGPNAFFPEFRPLMQQLHILLRSSTRAEEAIQQEPELGLMHERVLAELTEIVEADGLPYRGTIDAIMRFTEFFDMVERALSPEEVNPLHYAKRYEYYSHYMLGLAPKHFIIPSSISLATYSLLEIGGAPLGIAGVTDKNLWVDSYLQTPNEFLLHDLANHERRRYQFTVNYGTWLGVSEENMPDFFRTLDDYNRSEVLPMIKRLRKGEIEAIDYSASPDEVVDDFEGRLPGSRFFETELEELRRRLREIPVSDVDGAESEVERMRLRINDKKKLLDMILFEVVHEDALPPARQAIIESILRPPNLPMPRDFIDVESKTAVHSMENAGSTIAYIIHKLNGSFYDTPEKRLRSISTEEYRSPKKIVETTVELIENLGGYQDWSHEELLKNVVYLAMTDEGFMSYLVDEFQRDLHPIQRTLVNSLIHAESLEILSTIGEFDDGAEEFSYYLKRLRERIEVASKLSLSSTAGEIEEIEREMQAGDDPAYPPFAQLQSKYYRLSVTKNEELFSDINMLRQRLGHLEGYTLESLHQVRESVLEEREQLLESGNHTAEQLEALESKSYQLNDVENAIALRRDERNFQRTIGENQKLWAKVSSWHIDRDELVDRFATVLHDETWIKFNRLRNGDKARYKEVPMEAFGEGVAPIQVKTTLERLGYSGFRITPDGILEQNINVPSKGIIPELHQRLSLSASARYVDRILEFLDTGAPLTEECIQQIAGDFHVAWMENNTWQLERIFPKVGLDVSTMGIDEIVEAVDSLSEDQWNSMSVTEVEKLRQFLPVERMVPVDRQRNIAVIMGLVTETMRTGFASALAEEHAESWKAFKERDRGQPLAMEFSRKMHDTVWLPQFRNSNGMTKRWIDLPKEVFEENETAAEAYQRLSDEGYHNIRLDPRNGRLQQNVNLYSEVIHPALFEKQNAALAKRYIEIMDAAVGDEFTAESVMELTESFHRAFLEENRWHLRRAFDRLLEQDVDQMSPEEIQMAISKLDKNSWLTLTDVEAEKFRQFVPAEDLNWGYYVSDVGMFELLLVFHTERDL